MESTARALTAAILAASLASTGLASVGADLSDLHARLGTVETRAVQYHVAIDGSPDEQGRFSLQCFVEALAAPTHVKLRLAPSEGVTIVAAPEKMHGTIQPGRPIAFRIQCRLEPNAPRPAGVNLKLRYRVPDVGAAVHTLDRCVVFD